MRGRSIALLLGVALVAGCTSATKPAGPAGGAEVAPRSTAALVRLDSSFSSQQSHALDALLKLFPDGEKLRASLQDAKGALGPETDLLALTAAELGKGSFLGLTQPRNPAELEALLAKHKPPLVSEEVASWRVIGGDRAAIDAFKRGRNRGSLAGTSVYREATSQPPAAPLVSVYLDGAAATSALDAHAKTGTGPVPGLGRISWLAGAARAEQNGLALELRVKGDEIEAKPYAAELPAEVPAGVLLFVGFKGLDTTLDELVRSPAFADRLGSAAKLLGGLLDDVVALFKEEGALYAEQGPTGPVYTLVLKVADEQAASATLSKLATLASALQQKLPETVRVAGVTATKITVGTTDLYYALFGGKLVVSTGVGGIRSLRATTERLADSRAWQDAVAAAAVPEQTAGILYADVNRALPIVAEHVKDKASAAELRRYLAPFGTALLYASVDRSVLSVKGFVSVR